MNIFAEVGDKKDMTKVVTVLNLMLTMQKVV